MPIVESIISLTPFALQAIQRQIGKGITNEKSSEVIRRALRNELKFNLGIVSAVMPSIRSSSGAVDAALAAALVLRLESTVSEAIFAGVESELLVLRELNKELADILDEADAGDLPIAHSITNASQVDFSTLLGFVIRKIAEMKALAAIQSEQGCASVPKIDWTKRIGNLRDVMLFLVSKLDFRS